MKHCSPRAVVPTRHTSARHLFSWVVYPGAWSGTWVIAVVTSGIRSANEVVETNGFVAHGLVDVFAATRLHEEQYERG
jgi:hypothetical protein